jgi:hypothetical protein
MNNIAFSKGWSTHMPMLLKTVQSTSGAVLEIGSGLYSTPLLHWLCAEDRRKLVTHEAKDEYYNWAKKYQSKTHSITKSLDGLEKLKWSVVFIDGEEIDRADLAILFKDSAEYVVLHDSDERAYNYDKVFPHFKYRYDWTFATPNTTVLSNFKEL